MRRAPMLLSVLTVGVLASGCGGSSATKASTTPAPSAPASAVGQPTEAATVGTLTIVDGKPEGGVQRISTTANQPAVLLVTSNKATEVHVHGADRTIAIPANTQTSVDVSQSAPGSYEVEDHASDELLVQLRVS
ncbi:MAG: hypothetical protein QOJ32_3011 [Frankiaceae bacterium]|nr:hypothetical protein [Frankiaceae bacterium]